MAKNPLTFSDEMKGASLKYNNPPIASAPYFKALDPLINSTYPKPKSENPMPWSLAHC